MTLTGSSVYIENWCVDLSVKSGNVIALFIKNKFLSKYHLETPGLQSSSIWWTPPQQDPEEGQ